MVYGDLWEKESSWAHIIALQNVVTQLGCPLKYYVDNHSIFRFMERRDSLHYKIVATDETAVVQWREVLKDLNVDVVFALSAPAKGKIERPYQWLQDHLVRTCSHEKITKIEDAREVLYQEIYRYNHKRIHSTTKEIPIVRYEKALADKKSLFREFAIKNPYKKLEDIFCYRFKRIVNRYRKISINALEFPISHAPIFAEVELRISFDMKSKIAIIRFWYKNTLIGQQQVKAEDLIKVQF